MLNIHTLTLGLFQVNCYIVYQNGSDRCVVIDPGYDAKKILAFLKEKNLQLEAVLLTPGHFDHVGAVKDLVAATDCRVFLHDAEHALPHTITAGKLYATDGYTGQFTVAGMDILAIHTPGHTPGSVCLIIDDTMFSGDTLFAGSCGRTDLPGGDWATIQTSLHRLAELSGDYRVFPGHAEPTSLAQEKQFNPYMR